MNYTLQITHIYIFYVLLAGKASEHTEKLKSSSTADEPLDLADLDLSRLRLSKTDLETLSNIAPGLPKCFQEQLLAKLPPTQARKLSRTLSVQTGQNVPTPKIYKRSQSSSRASTSQSTKLENVKEPELETHSAEASIEESIRRQNINGMRTELQGKEHTTNSRAIEEYTDKEYCPLYTSDINEKYKYYSPYVNKTLRDTSQTSTTGSAQKADNTEISSMLGRPPSGRLSPSLVAENTGSIAKRPSQRRISRILRTDITEQPLEESPAESSKLLTENRENNNTTAENLETATKLKYSRHSRNKSMDAFSERADNSSLPQDTPKLCRRSLSRPRDTDEDKINKHELADKILQELQVLSTIRSQQEERECSVVRDIPIERIEGHVLPLIKKVKKVKASEKSTESSTDADAKVVPVATKKVKKIVKKSDSAKTPTTDDIPGQMAENVTKPLTSELYSPKKISKLKRPKSYPMKDTTENENSANSEMCNAAPLATCSKTSAPNETTIHEVHPEVPNSHANETNSAPARESRLLRPKSYPASKLTAPKELKKTSRSRLPAEAVIGVEKSSKLFTKTDASSSSTPNASSSDNKTQFTETNPTPTLKKTIKVTKKSKLSQPAAVSSNSSTGNTTSSVGDDSKESSPAITVVSVKEKPLEKKPGKGLLYAIGQKFEKLRASATSSNSCANIPTQKKPTADGSSPEKTTGKYSFVKKTKSLGSSVAKKPAVANNNETETNPLQKEKKVLPEGKTLKADKRSRIDLMIRNLRERSVPRSQPSVSSESNYIKRAVSVEEMPGTFNRKSVNKVLGLFKRYEKDTSNINRVRNARSASNIQRQLAESSCSTPIYQNADAILKLKDTCPTIVGKQECNCSCELKSPVSDISPTSPCPECVDNVAACMYQDAKNADVQNLPGNKDRRKGLMLKLMKAEKDQTAENANIARKSKQYTQVNDNEIYSNLPPYPRTVHSLSSTSSSAQTADNLTNNNNITLANNNNNSSSLNSSQTSGYRLSSLNECNQNNNIQSPSFDNIANYSSDSRSYQDDCASNSTFRSPTEEPELYFDNWSVCSEDNYRMHGASPSPTVSRLSRASQVSSPTSRRDGDASDPNESIVDRIRRRSFYCRFNEKKPKRTSSIVGPNAVREYYREQHSATKTRSANKINAGERERDRSPDITQEFFRPLKLSPIGTELKPPVYKSALGSASQDYSPQATRSRKSLSDIRPPPSPSGLTERRYGSFATPDNDLLSHSSILSRRIKTNTGDETTKVTPSASYYSTYNPKRRFSYNMNGSTPPSSGSHASTSGHFDGYATMGRRPIRAYDHRTMSLLEPSSSSSYRHETNTPLRDYTTSLSR